MAVPPWRPHIMASPSRTCWLACVRREASRWKMSSFTFMARTRWALSCSVSCTSHYFKSRSCLYLLYPTAKLFCNRQNEKDDYFLRVLTSSQPLTASPHTIFLTKSFLTLCEAYFKVSSVEADITLISLWYTVSLSTATLIAGPGLLHTERSAGLSRAQGDVCVSQLSHFPHFLFFCFWHPSRFSHPQQ